MSSVILFGGYGVFGSIIARELSSAGVELTVAGRDLGKAEHWVSRLGPRARAEQADALDRGSCLAVLRGHRIAIHCAGPYSENNTALVEACLREGCHYLDIADNRRYIARIRGFNSEFVRNKLAAVYGCSSLPGISGALVQSMIGENQERPEQIRVLLFIGNQNPKGGAALDSVLRILGQAIEAPLGSLRGWGDREPVELPSPFGKKLAYNFESAEYDLFPSLFGVRDIVVKVAFEFGFTGRIFSLLSGLPKPALRFLRRPVLQLGNWAGWRGSSGGAIQVRLIYRDGHHRTANLLALQNGQRMAILPAIFATQKLLEESPRSGVFSAFEFLGSSALLQAMQEEGYAVT